jgi:hypothetical protein
VGFGIVEGLRHIHAGDEAGNVSLHIGVLQRAFDHLPLLPLKPQGALGHILLQGGVELLLGGSFLFGIGVEVFVGALFGRLRGRVEVA